MKTKKKAGMGSVLWLLLVCVVLNGQALSLGVVEVYQPDEPYQKLQTIAQQDSGEIILGMTNRVIRLSKDLTEIGRAVTGPKNDSRNCPPPAVGECPCSDGSNSPSCPRFVRKPTNAISKGLAVDHTNRKLIACSTIFHGYCEKIDLDNMDNREPVYTSIVSSDIGVPVEMLVANGPGNSDVLYVASSWGESSTTFNTTGFSNNVPLIASRNLDTLDIAVDNPTGGKTEMRMLPEYIKSKYPVHYKYAFYMNGFTYFLVVQKKSNRLNTYESKIIRVCAEDSRYHSYAEINIKCKSDSYNIITAAHIGSSGEELSSRLKLADSQNLLYTTFAKGFDNSHMPSSDSVLCLYRLADIESRFNGLFKNCFFGGRTGRIGPAHLTTISSCLDVGKVPEPYCGTSDVNTPVDADRLSINDMMEWALPGKLLTGVISNQSVVYLSTNRGLVIKSVIQSPTEVITTETTIAQDKYILKDLKLDDSGEHLYAMTDEKLYKIQTSDCEQHTMCEACMNSLDPLCGWCAWENRCMTKSGCKADGWLAVSSDQCPAVVSVTPDSIQYQEASSTQITVKVTYVPEGGVDLLSCELHYEGLKVTTTATYVEPNIKCRGFPTMPPMSVTGSIKPKLNIKLDGKTYLSTHVEYYDCSPLQSCTACVSNVSFCAWNIEEHRCVFASDTQTTTDYVLSAEGDQQSLIDGKGPTYCPRIDSTSELLLASGSTADVIVIAHNFKTNQKNNLQCRFQPAGKLAVIKPAIYGKTSQSEGTITCQGTELSYSDDLPFVHIPVEVVWESNKVIGNPNKVAVKVYKCEHLVTDCGRCLALDPVYKCGWCNDKCMLLGQCEGQMLNGTLCPGPVITRFYPQSGPRSGHTSLTVHGINLGSSLEDLKVTVANEACDVQEDGYETSTTFVCRTSGGFLMAKSGPVRVVVGGKYTAESHSDFKYVNIEAIGFSPEFGPIAGGTLVTIEGDNLDAGSSVKAHMGTQEVQVISRNTTSLVLLTIPYSASSSSVFGLKFDMTSISVPGPFSYRTNPTVNRVINLETIHSGGTDVEFRGTYLNVVQSPKLIVTVDGETFESACKLKSAIALYCPSPKITDLGKKKKVPTATLR